MNKIELKHIPQTATFSRNIVKVVAETMDELLTHIANNNIAEIVTVFQQRQDVYVMLHWAYVVIENGHITQTFFDRELLNLAIQHSSKSYIKS